MPDNGLNVSGRGSFHKHHQVLPKQDKKWDKASARQLYKNIAKGTNNQESMVTKSFGSRKIDDLQQKITDKQNEISNKENNRFPFIKKVEHAFQKVKNWMLAGRFENNQKLLELAKENLPQRLTSSSDSKKEIPPVVTDQIAQDDGDQHIGESVDSDNPVTDEVKEAGKEEEGLGTDEVSTSENVEAELEEEVLTQLAQQVESDFKAKKEEPSLDKFKDFKGELEKYLENPVLDSSTRTHIENVLGQLRLIISTMERKTRNSS